MPSVRHHSFGDSAKPWPDIARYFGELAENAEALRPMAALAQELAQSDYARAGMYGSTSMYDLIIAQSRDIFGNPNLRIRYEMDKERFQFTYEDGSLKPWSRVCEVPEVLTVLKRFLMKRARWFRQPVAEPNG